jgi:hypothetical protein
MQVIVRLTSSRHSMHRITRNGYYLLIFFQLIFLQKNFSAEIRDTSARRRYERSLIISLDYSSDKIFYGRKGEEKVMYASPSVFYEAPSGFFTGLSTYRLIRPERYWDNSQLLLGLDFMLFKKINASASYSRFAYNDSSVQIQSTLKNNAELSMTIDSAFIQPRLTGTAFFGNTSPDFFLTFELAHEFCIEPFFGKEDGLYIRPAAIFSAGTLHYYRLALRDSTRKLPAREETKFNFSGIDFSLPLEYDFRRWIIGMSANYNIPENQPKYLNAKPGFYFTAGIGFRIY